ncbi:hypothetical protein [Cerasicoccus arenae]|uniref:PA14 domain-containing protein n=1 Tax=Cerasicoccus arenae TaxID=424488 RepID=A0A8J3DJT2_9BACT|nr:hypothetical protein [Cerasicoccus arenae]MBK1857864.1 hypothetical protein [Cerasicoccus arenae]GHC09323.1 hypothetical protein GCM10007047_28150 [Cerasicoccus arenae]
MASNLTSHKPLLFAFLISFLFVGAFSLTLLLNEDLRRYTIAQIEEITDEKGEKVKRVKIEKPEPNEEQVREISRNQERKKREELKKKAREMRETIYEIEEVVEAQKKNLKKKDNPWENMADSADEIAELSEQLQNKLADEAAPEAVEPTQPKSESLQEIAENYAEFIEELAKSTVTGSDAQKAVTQAEEVVTKADQLEDSLRDAELMAQGEDKEKVADLLQESSDLTKRARENLRQISAFAKSPQALQTKVEEPEKTADPSVPEMDLEKLKLDDKLGTAMVEDFDIEQEGNADSPDLNGELADGEISPLGNELPSDATLDALSTAELYEQVQEMSGMVDEAFAEGQAAEMANRKSLPLEQAREQVFKPESSQGPDLQNALSQNQPSNREEFQEFNEALDSAVNAAQQMARTAENRKSALTGESPGQQNQGPSGEALQAALQQRSQVQAKMSLLASNQGKGAGNVQDMRALMAENYALQGSGQQSGEGFRQGQALSMTYDTEMAPENPLPSSARLDTKKVLSQAVPGRRLDIRSKRQGWIFLDTWYVIGPWQRPQKKSFDTEFPPETLVDLDAEYKGKVNRYTKQEMDLKWRFVQTENIRINPPDEISDAVYYGYTEVFCEAATEVTVAVASDDMAKLWINDLVVFEDSGLSSWRMDEGFRTILLKPGYNTVLIRLENGPAVCYFSVLMCPTEALRN